MTEILDRPVFSWDHTHLSRPGHWFAESRAAVDCALELFTAMQKGRFERSWHRAKFAAFTFGHGIELFLKAAIAQAGKRVDPTHDLSQLYGTYRNQYAAKRFAFSKSMEEFVLEDPSKPYFSFLKYPEDEKGKPWPGNSHISIDVWRNEIAAFVASRDQLESEIKSRYSKPAAT